MHPWFLTRVFALLLIILPFMHTARGEQIKVTFPQGSAHGFVEVLTADGKRIAVGDLLQRARGTVITSELIMHFFDGSLDDETTVYSQQGVFRFISDHHVQRGPSFPQPIDTTVDARRSLITTIGPAGEVKRMHFAMPPDTYNGLASSLLMNISPATPETKIAVVVAGDKPRVVHLSMKNVGELPFTLGGLPRKATNYDVHIELGGVAGVVAPIIGKEPADYHVWILSASDPAFIREQGQLYEGGPIWTIQQISAVFPK